MSQSARALSRVLGHGSAHEGAHHWRVQRLTALALLLLLPWFVISLALLPDLGYATLRDWAGHLVNATLLALLLLAACWHSQLGVQVVIEDYVHTEWAKVAGIFLVKFAAVLLAAIAGFSVLKIAFTG